MHVYICRHLCVCIRDALRFINPADGQVWVRVGRMYGKTTHIHTHIHMHTHRYGSVWGACMEKLHIYIHTYTCILTGMGPCGAHVWKTSEEKEIAWTVEGCLPHVQVCLCVCVCVFVCACMCV
jgi:hypothetical protein